MYCNYNQPQWSKCEQVELSSHVSKPEGKITAYKSGRGLWREDNIKMDIILYDRKDGKSHLESPTLCICPASEYKIK